MIRYKCVKENRIYTEDQLRNIFRLAQYNGWHDDFEKWIEMEIKKGLLKIVTDDYRTTNVLDYMTGKRRLSMN